MPPLKTRNPILLTRSIARVLALGRPLTVDEQLRLRMPTTDESLVDFALRHIDEQIAERRAEHDDLVKQLRWLEDQKQELLEQMARERCR